MNGLWTAKWLFDAVTYQLGNGLANELKQHFAENLNYKSKCLKN